MIQLPELVRTGDCRLEDRKIYILRYWTTADNGLEFL